MDIRKQITVPVAIIVILSTVILTAISYQFTKNMVSGQMDEFATQKVQEVENYVKDQDERIKELKKELNELYITKARTLALIIAEKPEIINSREKLINLAKSMDVEEIHVIDSDGILKWGTVPEFYGFDFNTSEQTKPFLQGLRDKNFELAQEPQQRGTDKVLFQYIGVSRIDKPGIVQIGVKPERLQKELEKADIKKVSEIYRFGKNGFILVVDKNTRVILSHRDSNMVGKNLDELYWGKQLTGEEGRFKYNYDNALYFMRYKTSGRYIIGATVPVSDFTGVLQGMLFSSLIYTVLMILLSVILLSFVVKRISNPLKLAVQRLKSVARGELNFDVDKRYLNREDEIGDIARAMNEMKSSLGYLIGNLSQRAKELASHSESLSAVSEEMAASSQEVAKTIQQVAEGATSQANDLMEIVKLMDILSNNIENAFKELSSVKYETENTYGKADLGKKEMEKLIKTIEDVKNAFKVVTQKIDALTNSIKGIESFTGTISEISAQTNLLALNAAIEAARAGEAGKGFAVVAEEVRKLAEEARKSTEEINKLVGAVQKETQEVITTVKNVDDFIEVQTNSVNSTVQSFNEILESALKVAPLIERVYEAMNSITRSKDDVLDKVEKVSTVAEENSAASEEVSASSEELSASSEEVAASAQTLNSIANDLIENVKKFKI